MPDVLLITGSSGIAAATARLWAKSGAVFVIGVNQQECRALAGELGEAGWFSADVRDDEAIHRAVSACLEQFGKIDALFNVAGVSARALGDGPLHLCSTEAWDTVMDINLRGTFQVCREVLAVWTKRSEAGAIVNTGSVLARHPQRDHFPTVAYAASKGAIEALSLAAAAYYAPAGIRINVIAPGLVRTPMSARVQADAQITEYMAHKQPLSRGILSAEEIAQTACFLLRRESSPITGQVITVDGGWSVSE